MWFIKRVRCEEDSMNSSSTKFYNPGRMGLYEPLHHIGMWGETFRTSANLDAQSSFIIEADTKLETQVIVS